MLIVMRYKMLYVALVAILAGVLLSGCMTGIKPPRHAKVSQQSIVTTGYCKCGKCCNWTRTFWGKPVVMSGSSRGQRKKVGITASGRRAKVGTIAADTSIYPMGTVMYIPGYGYGRVEDRGGAIKGQHIDLFFKSHKKALQWGKQTKQTKIWTRS